MSTVSDAALVEALCAVSTEVRKMQHDSRAQLARARPTAVRDMEHALERRLTAFEAALRRADGPQLENVKVTFAGELKRLQHAVARPYRSLHDRIFVNLLGSSRPVEHVTRLFEDFVKGITYFAHEQEGAGTPIYHRLYSCGPYADTHRLGNLVCSEGLSDAELRRRRPLIERCYIERLIFDALYRREALHFPASGNVRPGQDDGHLFRLDLTRQDFETCFPDTRIEVRLDYQHGMVPLALEVVRTCRGRRTRLSFQKRYELSPNGLGRYEDLVDCTKEAADGRLTLWTNSFYLRSRERRA